MLWDKLTEIIRAVPKYQRIVVPSAHGVGKTKTAAHIALTFLASYRPAKVITTAPTWHQVKNLLWAEINNAHRTSLHPFGGTITKTKLDFADDWFAIGISTKEDVETRDFGAQRFQGFHSENLLVIIDEGSAVPKEIWTAIESLIVGKNNRVIAIGNPSSPTGEFYEACKDPRFHKIKISAFDHPNVKEGREVIPGAVTREWVEDKRQKWGEGSPLWQAKVLGEFPDEGEDTLIPLRWAEMAVGREDVVTIGAKRHAVDVARFGGDETVHTEMEGEKMTKQEAEVKRDTMYTAGKVMRAVKDAPDDAPYDHIIIDDDGVGGGVTDRLEEQGIDVVAFHGGGEPLDKERFTNRRNEGWWLLREAFEPKADANGVLRQHISIINDPELINQISSIRYKYNSKGQTVVESKAEMKKRGLKSPDRGDALMMANTESIGVDRRGSDDVGFVVETELGDE